MIYVGTAGWALGAAVKPMFADGASHLARYGTRFTAVEINSSFYRPHRAATYARWASSVPSDFKFAVKLPRSITHVNRLKKSDAALNEFHAQVQGLGAKLGAVLIQLPPSLNFDRDIAQAFLKEMRGRFPGLLALEPRHPGWCGAKARALLDDFAVVQVEADPAPVPNRHGKAGSRYLRLHGSPVIYRSSYKDAALKVLAGTLTDGDWCIFDNTAEGAAIPNALRVRQLASP
jgi:uncharacterized protein YecE (DUF72 family)